MQERCTVAIIKLANAGDSMTFRVKSAETVAGKFGAQVKFTAENGDCLFISEETAGRQLGRIPLDTMECAGETLTFSRTENPKGGAPYWNIGVADAVDRSAPPQSKRLAPPSKKPLPFDEESFPPEDAVYAVSPQEHMPVRQAGMQNLNAPAPTDDDAPEWVTETPAKPSGVAPNAEKKKAYITAYLDLLGYVRAHSGLKDEQAMQACCATIFIGLKQEGLR
jgi:hypothetical protein